MWDQWRTDTYDGMTAELISIKGYQGDEVHAYFARPNGTGPYPGIVLVHHLPGWDEFYRETARRFAEHGYVVICPDLYERFGHGTPEDVAAKARGEGGVADDSVVRDCQAALEKKKRCHIVLVRWEPLEPAQGVDTPTLWRVECQGSAPWWTAGEET